MDKLERTKEADEKKYKEAGIPWDKKIISEVKLSSLELMDIYMKIALEEVERLEKEEANEDKRMDKTMKILNGRWIVNVLLICFILRSILLPWCCPFAPNYCLYSSSAETHGMVWNATGIRTASAITFDLWILCTRDCQICFQGASVCRWIQ